jgi:WD40 repeat protein
LGRGTVNGVAFSPDGKSVGMASSLGIYLSDPQTMAEVRFIEAETVEESVAFPPNGQLPASGSRDKTVRL